MSRKTLIILALVLIPVAAMVIGSIIGIGDFLKKFPNAHFIIAFALGATATVLLSAGLFALTFLSSRKGFDDRVGNDAETGVGPQQDQD